MMKYYRRFLSALLAVLMLSTICSAASAVVIEPEVIPSFRSPTGTIGVFASDEETEASAEGEVVMPEEVALAGYSAVRDTKTAEVVFSEDVPEIGGKSTGVVAKPEIIPDFKSPTGTIGDFSSSTYDSVAPLAIDDLTVIRGSALFRESGVGARYYAFSGYGTSFTSAFANIKLPTGFNNAGNTRNAFISLGIFGSKHGIDLGIMNDGTGWYPGYYDVNVTPGRFPLYKAPSSATNAIITVKPVSTTAVHLYVQFTDASGNYVGIPFDSDITVQAGNLVRDNNGRFICRFYRFASLVPFKEYGDNQSDGSYMTGGQSLYCQLYNGSRYVGWGMTSGNVTNAWKVSSDKITLSYAGNNDTYNIRHR